MNTQYFAAMMTNCWEADTAIQGEYCVLLRDRLVMHLQSFKEATDAYPRATYVDGSIAVVEVFPGHTDIWHTQAKAPQQGEAIHLDDMGIYAVRPLEVI